MKIEKLKVVLVREFMTQYGGAERVLDAFIDLFPKAPIYTLIYDREKMGSRYRKKEILTSPLQRFPLAVKKFKWYLPLMPWATQQLSIPQDVDLVLSDSSAFAKGVYVPKGIPHICYLHTPTRYLWQVRKEYLAESPAPKLLYPLVNKVLDYQKRWDYVAAGNPDYYIANSQNIAKRLHRFYDRKSSAIIFPFVDTHKFKPASKKEKYFLSLGRIEPYKRIDLICEVALKCNIHVKIAGTGSQFKQLVQRYQGHKEIEFLGRVPDGEIPKLYAQAQAFIFPGEEDAGVTPLEAMASGTPVIAYGKGGALESVVAGKTGEFFNNQTIKSLGNTIKKFNPNTYDPTTLAKHAQNFSLQVFKKKISETILDLIAHYKHNRKYEQT